MATARLRSADGDLDAAIARLGDIVGGGDERLALPAADGQDAILRLGRVLTRLETLDRTLQSRPPHPLMGTGSLHASFVSGGHELSSYPDRALLQMERRTLPSEAESTVAR